MFRKEICIISLIASFGLNACNSSIQTTSGAEYNASVPLSESAIRKAANVEPLLKFPANFCIAKTERAIMVYPDPVEAETWLKLASRHADWGSFREVSPTVVNLVQTELGRRYMNDADAQAIRLAAARQHCDAVLSYDVRNSNGRFAASALLYDVKNGYTYLTADQFGSSKSEAVFNLAQDVEIAMSQLALRLK